MSKPRDSKKSVMIANSDNNWAENDPVYRVLSKVPTWAVWFIVAFFNMVVYVAVGAAVDHFYHGAPDLQGAFGDAGETLNSINVWLIFVPTIWTFYRWLPGAVIKYFQEIQELGVIRNTPENGQDTLSGLLLKRMGAKWFYFVALAGAIISGLYSHFFLIPGQVDKLGKINFWYYTGTTEFIFFLLYLPANYLLFVFAFRVLATVITINEYFQKSRIQSLYPLHPDKCGGMGNIGVFISRVVMIVVLIPVCITILALYPIVSGGNSQINSVLIVYAVYIIIVPFILIYPLMAPHKAMLAYKNKKLTEISKKLLETEMALSNTNERDLGEMKCHLEYYKYLQEMQATIEKQIPTWPISVPTLRSFSTITGSPVIIGLMTTLLTDMLKAGIQNNFPPLGTPVP